LWAREEQAAAGTVIVEKRRISIFPAFLAVWELPSAKIQHNGKYLRLKLGMLPFFFLE
jgi:hypothetical protein